LIISADAINDASPLLICLQVVEDEDPLSLLAPRVGGVGWAVATLIERTLKDRSGPAGNVSSTRGARDPLPVPKGQDDHR
jgi:hypothetical protein